MRENGVGSGIGASEQKLDSGLSFRKLAPACLTAASGHRHRRLSVLSREMGMYTLKKMALASLMLVSFLGSAWATTLEEQELLSARSIEMWSSGDTDQVDEVFADGYLNHQVPDVQGGSQTLTTDEWVTLLHQFHESFADTTVEILLQVAEEDLVATRWRFTATQTGTYLGLAPTDRTISWTGIQIDRFEDGLIAETWVNWDMYGMFDQLGLLTRN